MQRQCCRRGDADGHQATDPRRLAGEYNDAILAGAPDKLIRRTPVARSSAGNMIVVNFLMCVGRMRVVAMRVAGMRVIAMHISVAGVAVRLADMSDADDIQAYAPRMDAR